jgi:hypothetical protein
VIKSVRDFRKNFIQVGYAGGVVVPLSVCVGSYVLIGMIVCLIIKLFGHHM